MLKQGWSETSKLNNKQLLCYKAVRTYTELPISFLTFFFQWLPKLLTLCASENAKLHLTVTGIYNQQSALHSSHSQHNSLGLSRLTSEQFKIQSFNQVHPSRHSTMMAASCYLCLVTVSSRCRQLHGSQSFVIALTKLKFQTDRCCLGLSWNLTFLQPER